MQKYLLFTILALSFSCSLLADRQNGKLEIKPLLDNVYLHISYKEVEGYGMVGSNGLIVIDNNKAFIIDTPWTTKDTEQLLKWISDNGYQLESSISTHSHEDRTGGIGYLNSQSVDTYTSTLTNSILAENVKPLAKYTFSENDFSLSKGLVEVSFLGEGHTKDNLLVWLPKQKLLFGGCLVRSEKGKSLGYVGEASVELWEGTMDKVLAKYPDAQLVVPGHGKRGDRELLKHTKALARAAASALAQNTE